jgi:hypothetical protein
MKSVHKKSWKYDSGIIVCNVFVLQIHTASSPFKKLKPVVHNFLGQEVYCVQIWFAVVVNFLGQEVSLCPVWFVENFYYSLVAGRIAAHMF